MKSIFIVAIIGTIFHIPPQKDFAENYLRLTRMTMHGVSSETDIQKLMALHHDDVVYEHPKAGFKLESKAVIEKGKLSFLKSYGGTASDVKTRLIKQINNDNTLIIEFEIEFLTSENKKIKRTQIQVLELIDQKIKRIIDYW